MDNRPFRIGWLSNQSGVNIETIRYYEREGLLAKPPRTKGGYRSYGPQDARRLGFVRRTRDLGFSLDEVRRLLSLADQSRDRAVRFTPSRPCICRTFARRSPISGKWRQFSTPWCKSARREPCRIAHCWMLCLTLEAVALSGRSLVLSRHLVTCPSYCGRSSVMVNQGALEPTKM